MRHEFSLIDLKKIRRASIGVSMVLLLYAFAGVQIDTSRELSFIGIPITLRNASVVPWALGAAAIYGALKFWFYGMRRKSPWAVRKQTLDESTRTGQHFEINLASRADVLERIARIEHAFGGIVDGDSWVNKDKSWTLRITPSRSRIPSLTRDIDYSAPVWITCLALIALIWRYPDINPPGPPETGASTATFELYPTNTPLPAFRSGSAEDADGALKTQVCTMRNGFEKLGISVAVVVGYHDFRQLSSRARRRYASNIVLAQERAGLVSELFKDKAKCEARPLSSVLTLVAGPRVGPLDVQGLSHDALEAKTSDDRRVDVHGVWRRSSEPSKSPH